MVNEGIAIKPASEAFVEIERKKRGKMRSLPVQSLPVT
jgi:hypothetical protein